MPVQANRHWRLPEPHKFARIASLNNLPLSLHCLSAVKWTPISLQRQIQLYWKWWNLSGAVAPIHFNWMQSGASVILSSSMPLPQFFWCNAQLLVKAPWCRQHSPLSVASHWQSCLSLHLHWIKTARLQVQIRRVVPLSPTTLMNIGNKTSQIQFAMCYSTCKKELKHVCTYLLHHNAFFTMVCPGSIFLFIYIGSTYFI